MLRPRGISHIRHSFFQSYGAILPSSLERDISSILPYSGCLPVSDYGTIDHDTPLMVFLGSVVSMTSLWLSSQIPISSRRILLYGYDLGRTIPTVRSPNLLRHIKVITFIASSGILTGCPSTTLFSLALGSTNPGRINLPQETLDFRCYSFSL